jgi:PAS domain S-box-containing protein
MITRNHEVGTSKPADVLRLIGKISRLVCQVTEADLPEVFVRILEGARAITGLAQGKIALFEYVFNELHLLEVDGVAKRPPIRRKVSEDLGLGLPHRGKALGERERTSLFAHGDETLLTQPIIGGSRQLGELYIVSPRGQAPLDWEQRENLGSLASLAAVALERCARRRESLQLCEWLDAFSRVFVASRIPNSAAEVKPFLQEIADSVLRIFQPDFVVLYEYFEELGDVWLPPTLAGQVQKENVLRERGVAAEHKRSAVFRLLELQEAFYAEEATQDWLEAGLIDPGAGEQSFFLREGVVSSAGIPLRIENQFVGVLFVNYRRKHSFPPEFRAQLELFANQAALAIGNARFFLRSERYSREMETLNLIGRELGSAVTRDIKQIGRLIDEQTLQVIPTKNFFLCVYEAEGKRFTLPYIRDEHDTSEILEPRLHLGLTGYVCRTGKPLLATQERKRQLFAEGSAQRVGQPAAIWLGAPLMVRDKVIGALVVQDYEDETAFNKEHLKLLEAIASQAAIAIDNYRLLHDANLRLEELSALLALSQAFGARRLNATQLLSSILDHLCHLTLCDGSLLLLVDPGNRERLKVTAASGRLQGYVGKAILLDKGVSGKVARSGKPLIVNDYIHWPDRSPIFDPPPKRVCAVPLIWQDRVVGVMTLSSDSDTGQFSQREIEVLQRFAGPAAIAVQNARDSSFRDALIHAGPDAIVAVDKTGQITEFNEEAAKLFNYPVRSELIGQSVADLYWGGLPEARKMQGLLHRRGKLKEEEIFGRSGTGEKIPISLAAALLRDENGAVMGSVGILDDMRLQSLRGRTALLVDALREISDEEDLDRIIELVVDYSVTLLNADAGCLFLYKNGVFNLEFALPRNIGDLEGVRTRARHQLNALAIADPRQIAFLDKEGDEPTIQLLPNSCSSVLIPIRTEARLLAFLLIESLQSSHFSADQKLLEILASQAAVSINRVQLLRYREETQHSLHLVSNAIAVGQIATTFLHEAKNSLHGLRLAVQSVHEDLEREPDVKAKADYLKQLKAVQSEISRFDDLSRRLQRFTRRGLNPEKQEVYVNDIVTRTFQLLGSALRSRDMKPERRLDPSLDPPAKGKGTPVLVDENQIQQVLMNLILNAIAASPERKPLIVETKNRSDRVEIRVIDQGSGIPKNIRRKLFQPFFTTKKDGVGLGLFLSRILIEKNHQGSIEILSTSPGNGSIFSVQLPK